MLFYLNFKLVLKLVNKQDNLSFAFTWETESDQLRLGRGLAQADVYSGCLVLTGLCQFPLFLRDHKGSQAHPGSRESQELRWQNQLHMLNKRED